MSKRKQRRTPVETKARSLRSRMFRAWLMLAAPWTIGVTGLSIYDHMRAIGRAMDQQLLAADNIAEPVLLPWLTPVLDYAGPAILFYGVLPASLTFFLYVVFLPWADRWSSQGALEE